jgi:transposase
MSKNKAMQNLQHTVGADLSKRTIDLFSHQLHSHICIKNDPEGFKQMIKWMNKQNINTSEVMIVMEHTGLYSFHFENFLHKGRITFCKVPALEIKNSQGIARGKSDKIDAKRIAEYGFKNPDKLRIETQPSKELQRLGLLQATRQRLVRQKAALLNAIKEYQNIGLTAKDSIMRCQTRMVDHFEKEIEKIEKEIDTIVASSPSIKQNQCLLQSIKGVGRVLSLETIIKTRNFTRFQNARKFACFSGTAPFPYDSGTSIKKKTKVDHRADKYMKTLLDLSAKSAIQYDKELREYYLRRTENGKSKMSTINIVRNKILYRMFAVIKRQTPYVENYRQTA